jgi:hypothetical protein
MKIRQIKRTITAVALAVVITLACVAVSLAQDSSPVGFSYSIGLEHSYPDRGSTDDGYAARIGLPPQSSLSPISFLRVSQGQAGVRLPSPAGALLVGFRGAKPPKVALHLLDSVLLI